MRILAGFGAVIVLGMVTVIVMAVASPAYRASLTTPAVPHPTATTVVDEHAIEAVLIGGSDGAAYRHQLDLLAPKCQEPRERLAEVPIVAQQQLSDRGISQTPLSILTAVQASIPDGSPPQRCNDLFAAYVALRLHGASQ